MALIVKNLNVRGKILVGTEKGPSTWTLTFTGGDCGSISCETNTQTIPEDVTLYIERLPPDCSVSIVKNGNTIASWDNTVSSGTFSFNANDTLQFFLSAVSYTGTMTIKENNSSGRTISTFPIFLLD